MLHYSYNKSILGIVVSVSHKSQSNTNKNQDFVTYLFNCKYYFPQLLIKLFINLNKKENIEENSQMFANEWNYYYSFNEVFVLKYF